MSIKKILFTLILSLIMVPNIFAMEECSQEKINNLREELQNISIDYEIMSEGSTFTNRITGEEIDVSNKVKLTLSNVPDDTYLSITSKGNYVVAPFNMYAFLDGGVYDFSFYNEDCEEPVYTYQVKVPSYDPTNTSNVWSDGTSSSTQNSGTNDTENKPNIRLIAFIIILIVIIILMIFIIIKKRRKRESEVL